MRGSISRRGNHGKTIDSEKVERGEVTVIIKPRRPKVLQSSLSRKEKIEERKESKGWITWKVSQTRLGQASAMLTKTFREGRVQESGSLERTDDGKRLGKRERME